MGPEVHDSSQEINSPGWKSPHVSSNNGWGCLVSDLLAPPRVPFEVNAVRYHFLAPWDSITLIFSCTQVNKLSSQPLT